MLGMACCIWAHQQSIPAIDRIILTHLPELYHPQLEHDHKATGMMETIKA
jgi:hypothetical protein